LTPAGGIRAWFFLAGVNAAGYNKVCTSNFED